MSKDKSNVAEALKTHIRNLAASWPEGATSPSQIRAIAIEADIPADSQHPSAIEARKYTKLAREAKNDTKGLYYIAQAVEHHKDFMLGDDAATGKKFNAGRKITSGGPIRKKIAALLKVSPTMKNPELWDAVIAKLPKGWAHYDNRQGKYLEGPKAGEGMKLKRFYNVCGEERIKIK